MTLDMVTQLHFQSCSAVLIAKLLGIWSAYQNIESSHHIVLTLDRNMSPHVMSHDSKRKRDRFPVTSNKGHGQAKIESLSQKWFISSRNLLVLAGYSYRFAGTLLHGYAAV